MPSSSPSRTFAATAVAGVVIWLCFFSHLGALGLVGPDEPRYAAVARDMAASGDWVTPRLYGQAWFEKPVLYYWSAAICFRFLGGNEVPARLPSAIAALIAALATAWLAWKHYGPQAAWAALLIFPTCVAAIGFARAATPDMLFSATLALAIASAASLLRCCGALRSQEERRPTGSGSVMPAVFFGVWLGMATLAKGPAALVLAVGSTVLWAALARQWKPARRLAHPLAILSFCLVAIPWYALCAARNPEFLRTFLFQHNFERYLTPIFQHRQSFWFFGPILLIALLPWTGLLLGVAQNGMRILRVGPWEDSPGLFFACWVAFSVVFFSFSQSKLPGYVLPAIPPLAVLLSASLIRAIREGPRTGLWPLLALGATWIAMGSFGAYWLIALHPLHLDLKRQHHIGVLLLLLGIAAGLAIALVGLLRQPWVALAVSSLLVGAFVEVAALHFLPEVEPDFSIRPVASPIQRGLPTKLDVAKYRLTRTQEYGLMFYLGRTLPEWGSNTPRPVYVITNDAGLDDLYLAPTIEVHYVDTTCPNCLVRIDSPKH